MQGRTLVHTRVSARGVHEHSLIRRQSEYSSAVYGQRVGRSRYLDPPFNSNRSYNVLFKDERTRRRFARVAFEDTWHWKGAAATYDDLILQGDKVSEMLQAFRLVLNPQNASAIQHKSQSPFSNALFRRHRTKAMLFLILLPDAERPLRRRRSWGGSGSASTLHSFRSLC